MNKKEMVIGHVYEEFKPKGFPDYGINTYRVVVENNKEYLIKEKTIRTTFLRETIIYKLENNGYVSLDNFKKKYRIDNIPIKEKNIKTKIKSKVFKLNDFTFFIN